MGRGKQEYKGTAGNLRRGGGRQTNLAPMIQIRRTMMSDLHGATGAFKVTDELEIALDGGLLTPESQGQLITQTMAAIMKSSDRVFANHAALFREEPDEEGPLPAPDAILVKTGRATEAGIRNVRKMEAFMRKYGPTVEDPSHTGRFGQHLKRVREKSEYNAEEQAVAYERFTEARRMGDKEGARKQLGNLVKHFGRRVACVCSYPFEAVFAVAMDQTRATAVVRDLLGAWAEGSKGLDIPHPGFASAVG